MKADTFVQNAWYVAGMSQEFKANDLRGMVVRGVGQSSSSTQLRVRVTAFFHPA